MLQTKTLRTTFPLALAVASLLAYNFIGATWSPAPANPPSNNTLPPINEGVDYQSKSGDLGVVTMLSGAYCNAAGTSCIWTGGSANQFFVAFRDSDEIDGGIEVNNNIISILADRNNNNSFDDWQGGWPLQLHMNADRSQEYARFSNQVRATKFCNKSGDRCIVPGNFICPPNHAINSINADGEVVCIYVPPPPAPTYSWTTGNWGSCVGSEFGGTCGSNLGTKTRTVSCRRSDGVIVGDSYCSALKPNTTQSCSYSCSGGPVN